MKKNLWVYLIAVMITPVIVMGFLIPPPATEYVVLGWNDLGMHCSNKDFDSIVILPPYNNMRAQAIRRGDANQMPQVVDAGYTISYSIPGNTYSVGKTNFWDYEQILFGVNLPDNVGLAGAGLSGNMNQQDGFFDIIGIPITPFQDDNLITEDPYQLAMLQLFDINNQLLATTYPVIPVSNEINCVSSGCHGSQQDILDSHEEEDGFDPTNLPVLCSQCHADVALGMPGDPDLPSLSEAIHDKHKDKTNDCYKCHPGPNTQCFRDVMFSDGMACQDCHGDMEQVAQSIKDGRRPWLDEPKCGDCHGADYAEEPGKLYRESKGHGGLFCSSCHGSPHAIFPTVVANDGVQNMALQGHAGTLNDCTVCHGVIPDGPGPHGLYFENASNDASLIDLSVDGTTIEGFHPDTLDYIYTVPAGTTTVPVTTASPNNPGATADITPAGSLPGTTTVLVTAEDGVTTRTYTVEFIYNSVYFTEEFETGVPHDYYSGNLNLSTGIWNGRNVKSSSTHYGGGKSIQLKKESTSHLITPSVNGIGTITFYYKGNEDKNSNFKVQKRENNGSWQTLSTVTYKKGSWKLYSYTLNDPDPAQQIRILISNQKNLLLIDQFSITAFETTAPLDLVEEYTQTEQDMTLKSLALGAEQPDLKIYAYQSSIYLQVLKGNPGTCTVDIMDLSGRIVMSRSVSLASSEKISINAEAGCYIVRVRSDSKIWSAKVIIQ